MYSLYKTEGIVLESANAGESNKYISILTKDFGLIKALAKSVREEKSKLRYSLQDLSYINTSLVRGRDIWRITGAEERYNLYNELKDDSNKLFTITQVLNLLQRLVHGEEKNDYLFDTLSRGLEFLKENKMEKEKLKNFEHLIVLRILYSLGYIAKKESFAELLRLTEINQEPLKETESKRKDIIFAINRALKEAHL